MLIILIIDNKVLSWEFQARQGNQIVAGDSRTTMTFEFSRYKVDSQLHYRSSRPPAWIIALCWPIAHRGGLSQPVQPESNQPK